MRKLPLALAPISMLALAGALHAAELDERIGEGLARRDCAMCHTVGPTTVHELPPSFSELAQNPATTQASLEFLLTHPHDVMPNLQLGTDERAELIAYILSLRDRAK